MPLGECGLAGGAALGDVAYSQFGGEFVDPLGVEIFPVAIAVPFDGFLMVAASGFGDGVEKGFETVSRRTLRRFRGDVQRVWNEATAA